MASETTTIGISIGTRYVGYAVIVGSELRDWRLKIVQGMELVDKFQWLTGILAKLVETYAPASVAIKRLSASRSSPTLERLVLETKAYLESCCGVSVHELTLSKLKACLLPGQRANKFMLAEYVVSKHPVL